MKELVCDRKEAGFAVMIDENGVCYNIPLSRFSRAPKEGDVYTPELIFDPETTETRRTQARALFQKLTKKGAN